MPPARLQIVGEHRAGLRRVQECDPPEQRVPCAALWDVLEGSESLLLSFLAWPNKKAKELFVDFGFLFASRMSVLLDPSAKADSAETALDAKVVLAILSNMRCLTMD